MARKRAVSLQRKQQRMGYFFIFPLILGVLFVFLPNLLMTVQFSVSDVVIHGSEGYTLTPRGLEYYWNALTVDANFLPRLAESYRDMIINVPVILIFSLFIATLLNQKFRGRAIARAIFFIPVLLATGILDEIEGYILGTMNSAVMETGGTMDGALNFDLGNLLSQMNFNQTLIDIVEAAVTNIYTVLKNSGMQIYIFLAGLQEIPTYLYEAAEVEGCSKWEGFWKITFPMLAPQMAVNVVYTLVATGQGGSVLAYANSMGTSQGNYGLGTAMIVLYLISLAVVLSLLFAVLARFMRNQNG